MSDVKRKTVCFLGETATDKDLSVNIFTLIDRFVAEGIDTFLFSADSLFSLECAFQVLLRRKKQIGNRAKKITLSAYIPFENHIAEKDERFREKYFSVLEKCDSVTVFEKNEDEFIFSDFSEYIILRSDILICPEKGAEYEMLFAEARGKKIKAVTTFL